MWMTQQSLMLVMFRCIAETQSHCWFPFRPFTCPPVSEGRVLTQSSFTAPPVHSDIPRVTTLPFVKRSNDLNKHAPLMNFKNIGTTCSWPSFIFSKRIDKWLTLPIKFICEYMFNILYRFDFYDCILAKLLINLFKECTYVCSTYVSTIPNITYLI